MGRSYPPLLFKEKMSKEKNKAETAKIVQVTAEEISVVADHDFNFGSFKFKKGEPVNYSAAAFDELRKATPNLDMFVKKGAIKIV